MEEGHLPLNFLQLTHEISLCDNRLQELTERLGFAAEDDDAGVWQKILQVTDLRRLLVETELRHATISVHWIPIKQQLDLHVDPELAKKVCLGLQQELSKAWSREERCSRG